MHDELAINTDDGSCIPFVMAVQMIVNMSDELANTDDGGCIPFIYGCTDDSQYNYDELANTDDGSCCTNFQLSVTTDCWGSNTLGK